jgi:hypothetical protein
MSRRRNLWVVPHADGWAVRREGAERVSRVFETKQRAVEFGRQMAQEGQVELITQRRDGTIQSKDSYGPDPFPPRDTEH